MYNILKYKKKKIKTWTFYKGDNYSYYLDTLLVLKVIYKILHSPNQTIVSSISFAILEKARELQLHVKVYYYLINDILLKQSYMCLISSRI